MGTESPELTSEFAATADWYLTVRCSNPSCTRLIAFQKTRFGCGNPNLRLAVIGKLSIACPHCKQIMRFHREQIERRPVVLTQ
jgi:phage FluMu protein Com